MNATCTVSGRRISPETRIYQLSAVRYYRGYETHTYESNDSVVYECHEECFAARLNFQAPPYDCSLCEGRLDNGARVVYLVVGDKPALGYTRPECRGHEMPFVAHDYCFENK